MQNTSRLFLVLAGALGLGLPMAGCSDNAPAGAYADMQWAVRCEAMSGCTRYPDRDVLGFDGENGVRFSCNVSETDTNRTLSFDVSSADYGLALTGAVFPRNGGGASGSGCRVRVTEDNVYTGTCGAATPSPTQPCRVNDVAFTVDGEGRSLISGTILCGNPAHQAGEEVFGVSPSAAPTIRRELTGPGASIEQRRQPMRFNIYDCPGYNPD